MIKVGFGFLVKDKIHLEKQWIDYLTNSNVYFHCYGGKYTGNIPGTQVKLVSTDWAWTVLAHLELFREFLKSTDTHLCILSESCIPVRSKLELESFIQPNKSYFNGLQFRFTPNEYRRKVYRGTEYFRDLVIHEQWTILCRKHVELLLQNEDKIIKNFARKFADNEHYAGTILKSLGLQHEMVDYKLHYLVRKTGAHPIVHNNLTTTQLDRLAKEGYFFLRKVSANTKIDSELQATEPIVSHNLNIQSFGIVHNQDLLLEKNKVYSQLENFKWLLVSPNPDTDKLTEAGLVENIDYIVCSKLPNNIEDKKELLHITAYYALINNNLLDKSADYYRIIEYDLVFERGVEAYKNETIKTILATKQQVYCHLTVPLRTCWVRPYHLAELNEKCLKEKFRTDIMKLTKASRSRDWMCSTNFVMSPEYLTNIWNFTQTFLPYYYGQTHAGNAFERLHTIYCYMKGITWRKINGVKHDFRNSHGTS